VKFSNGILAILAGAMLVYALPQAFGEDVSVKFTGPVSASWSGVEAGSYTGTIDGAKTTFVCDDYADHIGWGEVWTATKVQASTLTAENVASLTLFGSAIGITGYAEVATLIEMMYNKVTSYGSLSGITQADLSAAIWAITGQWSSSNNASLWNRMSALEKELVAAVEAAFTGNDEKAEAYLSTLTDLWILVPDPMSASAYNRKTDPTTRPQEVWTRVPEGGASLAYLLLGAIFCIGALRYGRRNAAEVQLFG
jgi:hypothetical protein